MASNLLDQALNIVKGLGVSLDQVLPGQAIHPTPTPTANPAGNALDAMKMNVTVDPSVIAKFNNPSTYANPNTSVNQVAPAVLGASANNSAFRFDMGKSDYSYLKPQLDRILGSSPLAKYTNDFIDSANKHKVDPRVLVTIANNESSLGKNYPIDSNNPFGYNASGAGYVTGPDGKQYVNVDQGLKDAGFTSLPMAIDALTGRFERQPTQGYQQFYNDPTISNLQNAYNANPAERDNYLRNAQSLLGGQ